MGYFSNGSEGSDYQEQYCSSCAHGANGRECAVWLAHLLHAYDVCDTNSAGERILSLLIPGEGSSNGKCRMHLPVVKP